MKKKDISILISLILRHKPSCIGLVLDKNGWADSAEMIQKINANKNVCLDMILLEEIVKTDDKQRYSFNDDKSKIRANQGHSIDGVDLNLTAVEPPSILFHGTALKSLESIKKEGLTAQSRKHVHLSLNIDTATKVGSRHGTPIILNISAGKMHSDGHQFFCSENGVWLTGSVPVAYIEFP